MFNFLFSPVKEMGRGCLFGAGCLFGLIIALLIIGTFFGVVNDRVNYLLELVQARL